MTYVPERGSALRAFLVLAALVIVAVTFALGANPARADTFTVNSTADTGDATPDGTCDSDSGAAVVCALREAIEEANANNNAPTIDTINFNIPGTGVQTISPTSVLPSIMDPVMINGYSQPGASANTKAVGNNAVLKIELSGSSAGTGVSGIRISASNSTIKGLIINRWSGNGGVDIQGTSHTGNRVQGNFIGTDQNGTTDQGNANAGVYISDAPGNLVGGTSAGARNVISGNDFYGIAIRGTSATDTLVQGNYIGTDKNGTGDLGNNPYGVYIDAAPDSTVGGTSAGARNVISGNDAYGVLIQSSGATGNLVQGNFIGTDATGKAKVGNTFAGVLIDGQPDNTIGGVVAGAGNVISGNGSGVTGSGVIISNNATGNKVQGNRIGTDAAGKANLGNTQDGVFIDGSDNTVGGTTAGEGNIIAYNGGNGVLCCVLDTGNRILSNSIYSNGQLGIDLEGDGVTPNDGDNPLTPDPDPDGDTGDNLRQNFPDLTSAKSSRLGTTIKGTLNSTPTTTFTLQFFSGPAMDLEGKKFMGQKSVTTDASGNASFTFKTKKKAAGEATATATNVATGDTSEFSAARPVQ